METKRRSVWDVIQEQYDKYQTLQNTYEMFKPGDTVRIITPAQDHNFFDMENSYGRVVSNLGKHTGITVFVFDVKGPTVNVWGFEPMDLIHVDQMHDERLERAIQEYIAKKEFPLLNAGTAKFYGGLLSHDKTLFLGCPVHLEKREMEYIATIFLKYFQLNAVLMRVKYNLDVFNR